MNPDLNEMGTNTDHVYDLLERDPECEDERLRLVENRPDQGKGLVIIFYGFKNVFFLSSPFFSFPLYCLLCQVPVNPPPLLFIVVL